MNDINQSEQSFIAHTIIVAHIYNIPYIMSLTNHSAHILNKIELTNCALRVERGVIIKRTMDTLRRQFAAITNELYRVRHTKGGAWVRVLETTIGANSATHIHFPPGIATTTAKELVRRTDIRTDMFGVAFRFSFFTNKSTTRRECMICVNRMLTWLGIIYRFCKPTCLARTHEISVDLYFTSARKQFPPQGSPLVRDCVNTAFTQTCAVSPNIVIFRKEEWFKAFIHECFHTYGLDFSGMGRDYMIHAMRDIFPVDSTGNLFETYAETWARIIHCAYCAFEMTNNASDFWQAARNLLHCERIFSIIQLINVLNHVNLDYDTITGLTSEHSGDDSLHSSNSSNLSKSSTYKETTNVVAYYIAGGVLMINCGEFIEWCASVNDPPLQFRNTQSTLRGFCSLLKTLVSSNKTIQAIQCISDAFRKTHIQGSLRMSICELKNS
jgi:hypothetical protein